MTGLVFNLPITNLTNYTRQLNVPHSKITAKQVSGPAIKRRQRSTQTHENRVPSGLIVSVTGGGVLVVPHQS